MAAVYVSNIVINAGTDFGQTFTLENSNSNSVLDLSNYSVSSQMRKHAASSTAYNFDATIIDPLQGKINIGMTSTTTSSIRPGRYLYDINIYQNNITTRVIEGMVLVREGVTR